MLSASVQDHEKRTSFFVRPETLDLRKHFRVLNCEDLKRNPGDTAGSEADLLQDVIRMIHDKMDLTDIKTVPPWRLDICPLPTVTPSNEDGGKELGVRILISWSFWHSHGDGMSGFAFHRTFLQALRESWKHSSAWSPDSSIAEDYYLHPSLSKSLPYPSDMPETMPITWSYFLNIVLETLLPTSFSKLLGIKGVSPDLLGSWTGAPASYDPSTSKSGVKVLEIDPQTLASALSVCRKQQGVKLTALLHQLILRAISAELPEVDPDGSKINHFVSQTPINLRKLINVSNDVIGVYPTGLFFVHPRPSFDILDNEISNAENTLWHSARAHTEQIGIAASSLVNQPIGLFRYIKDFGSYMTGKIGKKKSISWEVSNLLTFNPITNSVDAGEEVCIEKILFSQQASALDSAITFNAASVNGGNLVICVTWQVGSLGLGSIENAHTTDEEELEEKENQFVSNVCESISKGLQLLVQRYP